MNTALWCVQAVLAFAFGMAGVLKLALGASESPCLSKPCRW